MPASPWLRVGCECASELCEPLRIAAWQRAPSCLEALVRSGCLADDLLPCGLSRHQTGLSQLKRVSGATHPFGVVLEGSDTLIAAAAGETSDAIPAGPLRLAAVMVVVDMYGSPLIGVQGVRTEVAESLLFLQQGLPLVCCQAMSDIVRVLLLPLTDCRTDFLWIACTTLPGVRRRISAFRLWVVPIHLARAVVLAASAPLWTPLTRIA